MKNITLKWGLIGGMILILGDLLLYLLNINDNTALQYLFIFLCFLSMFFGQKEYQNIEPNEFYSFKQMFKIGFYILIVFSIINYLWTYINISFIDTDMIKSVIDQAETDLEARGLSVVEIENAMKSVKKISTPAILSFSSTIFKFLAALFLNILSSLFTKTKK